MRIYVPFLLFTFVLIPALKGAPMAPDGERQATSGKASGERASETLELTAERSHAGGHSYIPVKLTLRPNGVEWSFQETFKRNVDIPWQNLEEWSCWGESYGFALTLNVSTPADGGGTFRLGNRDLAKVVAFLGKHVPSKQKRPGRGECF